MFELKCPAKCTGCRLLDLEITNLYAGDQVVDRLIRCRNEGVCEYFEARIRRALAEKEATP